MARTMVWATQKSWQRLVGFAFTTEEDLLRNTPRSRHLVAQNPEPDAAVKKEEDMCGVNLASAGSRHKMPKLESTTPEGYQTAAGRAAVEVSTGFHPAGADIGFDPEPEAEELQELKPSLHSRGQNGVSGTQLHGMQGLHFKCQHPGCDKFSTPAEDGDRTYCLLHMKDYGQQPVLKRRKCQHPGCQKQARKSSEGQTLYCKGHMKQHGLSPNVPKCRHSNCEKQAQLSVDGQTLFCKVHMKENGLIPRQRVCAEGSCQKRVKQSLQGPGMFCIAHMKQHGLTPKLRLCQHTECSKQAVPDVEGKRLFCVAHMKEHGMEPYFRLRKCQAPNCDKKAKSDTGGKKTFCSFHARVFEELQNNALANYQSDADEEE